MKSNRNDLNFRSRCTKIARYAGWTVAGCAVGGFLIFVQTSAHHREARAQEQEAWAAERSRLEAQLEAASGAPPLIETIVVTNSVVGTASVSPDKIMGQLVAASTDQGSRTRKSREVIKWMELLVDEGENALPVIGTYLQTFQDADIMVSRENRSALFRSSSGRGEMPEFLVPPTLRLGLLDVVRRIGGDAAESILAETLASTGLASEVAWLSGALNELAPNKYDNLVMEVSRDLLINPPEASADFATERSRDEFLYQLLASRDDPSAAGYARATLLSAEGKVDGSALRYLEKVLDDDYIEVVRQTLQDPRVTDSRQKSELIEETIERLGRDERATDIVRQVVMDPSVAMEVREEALRDFDDEGIDERNPRVEDRPVIESRMQMLLAMAPDISDPKLQRRLEQSYSNLEKALARSFERERKQRGN